MLELRDYFAITYKLKVKPNRWDFFALIFVLAILIALAAGAQQMSAPFHLGQTLPISLDPHNLPRYALQTVLRMGAALLLSLLFTFTFATWAAKSRQAEKIIIPMIDVLQSVPVLAFLSITIVGFIALFPNSLLGPQCASIFLIFTAQAWNMALSFYQALRTVPYEYREAAAMFHLSAWQRFWRIEVPFAMPGLLWNMMMSMSASWFSLVASEAISVSNQEINLPGIGSYIAAAIRQADTQAVFYAIGAMIIIILLYDQLLLRPLMQWSEKFKAEQSASEKTSHSWVISLLQRTQVMRYVGELFNVLADSIVNARCFKQRVTYSDSTLNPKIVKHLAWCWNLFIAAMLITSLALLARFILAYISPFEILQVVGLGCITAARVMVLIIVCSIVWVPIGVWIGLRPLAAEIAQPIAQFLAAFPANLLFPIVVVAIIKYDLNVEIWTTPLMILGAQWYILFNVIAGTSAIPKDLRMATDNFGVRGWLWWRRLILPAVFPYYITGAITAVGGAWNASIVAEVVNWGNTSLKATGLGAYISEYTGDYPHTALGVTIMCLFVLTLNRLIWRPLYRLAEARFSLN